MYKASPELEQFILSHCPKHHPTHNAPDSFKALREWFRKEGINGGSMPVHNGGCNNTIWSSDAVIHAYRAWHDRRHLELHENFQASGEWRVALDHVREARKAGLSREDVKALLCWHWGQVRYYWTHKDYVQNPGKFVEACMKRGIAAVLASGEKF